MATHLGIYTPDDVTVIVNGRTITGFAEGEFVRTERNVEDEFTAKVGAKGDYTFVENLDKSGRLIIVLKQNAPDNTYLQSLLDSRTAFSFSVQVAHQYEEVASATIAMIGGKPRKVMGQDEAGREWMLIAGVLKESDKSI